MLNAKDFDPSKQRRILVVGEAGSGKTSQIRTLPGRKFAYIFDPNALPSLEGADIDYLQFSPDIMDLNISAQTLRTGIGDKPLKRAEPVTYREWEKDFEEKLANDFFKDYDWLCFDSFTTWSDCVMDRLLWLNNRLGKQPEQADWGAQVTTIQNVFRVLTNLPLNFYCTGHTEIRQDDLTKRVYGRIMMTGRLRQRLPLLFTDIFASSCESTAKEEAFSLQTRPDREHPVIRTALRGLPMYCDVTIQDFSKPTEYGLGALLKTGSLRASKSAQAV